MHRVRRGDSTAEYQPGYELCEKKSRVCGEKEGEEMYIDPRDPNAKYVDCENYEECGTEIPYQGPNGNHLCDECREKIKQEE